MTALPPSTEQGRAYAWYATAFLTVAFAVSFVERMLMALMVQPIKADLGLTDTQISLLHGFAFVLFYVVLGLPISRLADRWSRRGIIAISIAVWSVATLGCGLAKSFGQMFLSRVGVGIGEAGLSPASYSMMADLFPPDRLARPIGVYSLGIYAGSGLAFMAGGALVHKLGALGTIHMPVLGVLRPWQVTFIVAALPGIALLALMKTIREPPRRSLPAQASQGGVIEFIATHRRFFACHFIGFSLMVVFMGAQLAWMPTFFIRTFEWSAARVGLVYGTVFMLGGVIGVLASGWLVERLVRLGRKDAIMRVASWGCIGLIVPALLATLMPTGELTAILLLPAIVCYAMPIALAPAALQRIAPAQCRAQLAAIYLFVASLIGLAGGPTVVALFTDYVFKDEQAIGWSLSGVALLTLPFAALLLRAGRRPFAMLLQP